MPEDARHEAGGARRDDSVQGPGVEVAATLPEQPAERDSHIAPRASNDSGISGGAPSAAPPDLPSE